MKFSLRIIFICYCCVLFDNYAKFICSDFVDGTAAKCIVEEKQYDVVMYLNVVERVMKKEINQ